MLRIAIDLLPAGTAREPARVGLLEIDNITHTARAAADPGTPMAHGPREGMPTPPPGTNVYRAVMRQPGADPRTVIFGTVALPAPSAMEVVAKAMELIARREGWTREPWVTRQLHPVIG